VDPGTARAYVQVNALEKPQEEFQVIAPSALDQSTSLASIPDKLLKQRKPAVHSSSTPRYTSSAPESLSAPSNRTQPKVEKLIDDHATRSFSSM
jgi:hypothetical protein